MRVVALPHLVLLVFLAPTEMKALVGKWTVTKAELGGQDVFQIAKDLKFEILEGGKYTSKLGEEQEDGSFRIDAVNRPKVMDLMPINGPGKGKTIKAIYKLEGDTLTVCYADGPRPTKFATKSGTTELLMVYKREKK
jgi:uncharacterized protein (TIGR03067 family)